VRRAILSSRFAFRQELAGPAQHTSAGSALAMFDVSTSTLPGVYSCEQNVYLQDVHMSTWKFEKLIRLARPRWPLREKLADALFSKLRSLTETSVSF